VLLEATSSPRIAQSSAPTRLDTWSWRLAVWALSALGFFILLTPTLIVLATSLNGGYLLRFPPEDVSLRWYVALWTESEDLQSTAWTSFQVSGLATIISVVIATPAALVVSRSSAPWARALETAFLSPLMVPGVALGLGILLWLSLLGMRVSFETLLIGHIAICAPYIFRTACIGLGQLDPTLIEVSRSLGARPVRTFRRVILPLAAPSILAGAFIGFMYSFDNVAISIFLSDARTQVLPIRLWSLMEDQLDVRIAAVSGVLIVTTVFLVIGMEWLFNISKHVK
jgi:putative spermidine/putrescine transport system permease protein